MDLSHLPRGKPKRILLLLLLITLVSVLSYRMAYNFNISEWYKTITVSFERPELETKTSAPEPTERLTTPTPQRPQPCSYKYISPGNAEEGHALLDSIAWPDTPPLSKPFSLNLTTCPAKSSFTIVPQSGGWRVGDELTVKVQLRDYNGNPKRRGGDFLYGRLYNRALGAGVVGQVQDHLNGTFTVVFPLLWNGTANAEVVLVHTAESITALKRLSEEHPDRIWFSSDFRLGRVIEQSTCNVCLDPNKGPLCNFTDLHTGEQWFCYKPKTLACDTRVNHVVVWSDMKITREEEALFQTGKNLKVGLKASGISTATILPKAEHWQRLMSIRRAVGRLLNRAPGTKVIVRTGNMKHLDLNSSACNSDWDTLQRDKVLRAVFKDSGVLLLEAWEMVQACDLPHDLHPPQPIIKLMVDMILSNTCP